MFMMCDITHLGSFHRVLLIACLYLYIFTQTSPDFDGVVNKCGPFNISSQNIDGVLISLACFFYDTTCLSFSLLGEAV